MHAFCYGNPEVLHTVKSRLWERGGFWDVAKRTNSMPGELSTIADTFAAFCERFGDVDPIFQDPRSARIGRVLQDKAEWLAEQLDAEAVVHGTLIHGDYKNANIFFKRGYNPELPPDGVTPGTDIQMSLIDFQWSGLGLGVQDVIYLLVTSAPLGCLNREPELLQFYLRTLNHHLESRGVAPLSADVFATQCVCFSIVYARLVNC